MPLGPGGSPDLYDNFGNLASAVVPVQCPNNGAAGARTIIYVPIPDIRKGDLLDISASIVLNDEPQNAPVVTGTLLWVEPTSGVPGWSPTAINASLRGTQWETSDLNYNPASGAGKYLAFDRRLTFIAPFDMGDCIALLSAYAASDVAPGAISVFPAQTSIRALHCKNAGRWQAVLDDTMTLHPIV